MSEYVQSDQSRSLATLAAQGRIDRSTKCPALLLLAMVLVGWPAGCTNQATAPSVTIRRMLNEQAEAWNMGDLDTFMNAYWRSAELTFSSGGNVTRGWTSTLDNYKRRYPSREAMGHLTFSNLEITPLGADAALVLGNWRLERAEPVGGVFSLVVRHAADRWVIIHDHTSRQAP